MSGLLLEKGIGETEQIALDAEGWLKKLIEAIKEDLLSPNQISDLLNSPEMFLMDYTDNPVLGNQIYNRIVKLFFVNMIEMKERKKNKQKTLADSALDYLQEKLSDVDNISAVDMSQIYKNIKE